MEIFGWGRKNTADVTEDGHLKTWAVTVTEDHLAAKMGDAYTADIDGITVAADDNWLMVLKNTHSSINLHVSKIVLAPNSAKEDQELEVLIGGSFSYLAEGVEVTPTNMLSGRSGGADVSCYVSDGGAAILTTVVAGNQAARYPMPLKKEYVFVKRSGFLIEPNGCFQMRATKDEKFRGFVSFYFHE